LQSKPPKKDGTCDSCGAPLQQRADDCEETVRNRLAAYEKSTAPLIGHYSAGDYKRVEGTGTPDEVLEAIVAAI
jgi:adenylate kinase